MPWMDMNETQLIQDVRVPEQLQRAMAAEAEAARNARAKVIAAEGEHKASRSLRQAAEVIMDSPAALQVVNTAVDTVMASLNAKVGKDCRVPMIYDIASSCAVKSVST